MLIIVDVILHWLQVQCANDRKRSCRYETKLVSKTWNYSWHHTKSTSTVSRTVVSLNSRFYILTPSLTRFNLISAARWNKHIDASYFTNPLKTVRSSLPPNHQRGVKKASNRDIKVSHSLVRSLTCSQYFFVCFLRTARFILTLFRSRNHGIVRDFCIPFSSCFEP